MNIHHQSLSYQSSTSCAPKFFLASFFYKHSLYRFTFMTLAIDENVTISLSRGIELKSIMSFSFKKRIYGVISTVRKKEEKHPKPRVKQEKNRNVLRKSRTQTGLESIWPLGVIVYSTMQHSSL